MNKWVLSILLIQISNIFASPIDSNHFKVYKNDIVARVFTSSDEFFIKQVNDNDKTAIFKPNKSQSLGFGLSYKWLSFNLGFTVADLNDNRIYGKSSESHFSVNVITKKHIFRLNSQEYKGFYIENFQELGLKKPINAPTGAFPNMPNLKMSNLYLDYNYFFRGDRFSISPYIMGNTIQKKSGGSFTIGSTISLYNLSNDSAFVKDIAGAQNDVKIKSLGSIAPYITAGYGHNFVIFKNIHLLLTINMGPGIEFQKYTDSRNNQYNTVYGTFKIDNYIGLMYSNDHYFVSLTNHGFGLKHSLPKASFETLDSKFMLNFGYRFKLQNEMKWIGNKIGL